VAPQSRYGPLRLIAPWVAIGVGLLMVVKGFLDLGRTGEPLFLYLGSSLVGLGIIAFFVYRWMAKRGI
jgi:hypothetical protein